MPQVVSIFQHYRLLYLCPQFMYSDFVIQQVEYSKTRM